MLYNPKDYRTNRKAVLILRKRLLSETITTADAIKLGAKKSQLLKWVNEGKLKIVHNGKRNRYNKERIKALIFESLKNKLTITYN